MRPKHLSFQFRTANRFLAVIAAIFLSVGWQEGSALRTLAQAPGKDKVVPELKVIEAEIEAEIREKAEIPFEAAMKTLRQNYVKALTREMQVLKNSGKLEAANAVKVEIQDFSVRGVPATNDADVPGELQRLRSTFRTEKAKHMAVREKRMKPVVESFDRKIEDLEFRLTRDGRIDDAKAVKRAAALYWIERSEPAVISSAGEIGKFSNGVKVFSNRGYLLLNIPDDFPKLRFILNAGGAKVERKIKVDQSGVVYIGVDANNVDDQKALADLDFFKIEGSFNYSGPGMTPMLLFARVLDRSIELPPPTSFPGFIVIGDLRN